MACLVVSVDSVVVESNIFVPVSFLEAFCETSASLFELLLIVVEPVLAPVSPVPRSARFLIYVLRFHAA